MKRLEIGSVELGDGAPLVLIAGLNVLDDFDGAIDCARGLQDLALARGIPLVFKASFDKANRSQPGAFRGPGIDEGLRILERVREQTGLPLLTDVHEAGQAKLAAEVVDCLQVPAFLVRQIDLLAACGATGLPINLKKGQFIAPQNMVSAVYNVKAHGAPAAMVTERGTTFGYNNLVVDMRSLALMREFAPVCFDATHSVQYPGAHEGASGGDRRFVAPLSRAAVATGVDALFVEVHPDPERAPCDGASQISPAQLGELIDQVIAIDRALREGSAGTR